MALLAQRQPQKFDTGHIVNLQNDWMQRANSVNFHHFFPKAYLKKQGYQDWEANLIGNITLVDDFLNKRVIRARAPSDYLRDFENENDNFAAAMASHLVGSKDADPVWSDDYETFLDERNKAIVELLNAKLAD